EHRLTLPDSALAREQKPHPVDVGQRSVNRGGRGEVVLEKGLDPGVELGRLQQSPHHRNATRVGQVEQRRGWLLPLGDEDDRDLEGEEEVERAPSTLVVER